MSSFHLRVVTYDRLFFEGEVEQLVVRTSQGDMAVLKNHIKLVTPLGIGRLRLWTGGQEKEAALAGGFIKVDKEETVIVALSCEWAQEIDIDRAKAARERAEQMLKEQHLDQQSQQIAEMKLKRALNRIDIGGQ